MTAITDQQTMPQFLVAGAASVNMAFGTPIAANGRTVIPVAMVRMGFRGGFGSRRRWSMQLPTDGQKSDNQSEKQPDVAGGVMSRLVVRPIGFIELTDYRSRFVTIIPGRFVALGFGLAMLVGGLLMGGRQRWLHQMHNGGPMHRHPA
jgi:uncharacterized spore protein YtfJ